MITPENHNEENYNQENEEKRKTIYKETQDDGEEKDQGDSSSVADIGRTDFVRKPERKHNPLGSGHEPGTV
ncbi:hypothetical protein IWX76_001112 [Pedobacter sp. CAN_A7]|uniref:hypothetical protein n=1 Tax=Pedobacter sp. CAN_A7 TaxID=2787722 RepID=UPI0018CBC2C2